MAMKDKNVDNIASEENTKHFPCVDVTVGDTYGSYVTVEINRDHSSVPNANSSVKENRVIYATVELTHDHFRFAYDLGELVLDIRNQLNRNVPHNLPEPSNYLFTKEHARIVKRLLETDTSSLLEKIHSLTNTIFNYDNFLVCREYFVQEWKIRAYTEVSFISACATIAFVAAYFIEKNYYCGALDNVVEFIAIWVRDIMERGTIDNSCW